MIHLFSFPKLSFRYLYFGSVAIMMISFGCRSSEPVIEPVENTPLENEIITSEVSDSSFSYIDSLPPNREFRAVWVATVANIDWPSEPGLPVEQQKEEMIDILDRAAALNFNAIIFQVRPAADALYPSPYEPWSYYLTGKMGQHPLPSYDPLEFAVTEAHQRGLELHAWFNPYRASHPTDKSEISPNHISKTQPDWVHEYGDYLWLDPGIPEVRQHTINVILDVVERYDIDGVHFDDYFYPYPSYADGANFPDTESWQQAINNGTTLSRKDWRRQNINLLIEELSKKISNIKPHVKFGISPFGIWRAGYPRRTTGFDAYDQLYADARLWLKEGWVDYFSPQIFYRMNQADQPFPIMLDWWADQNDHKRHIWPGLFTSRIRSSWPINEITSQLYTAKAFPNVTGVVHFSMKPFLENPDDFNQILSAGPNAYPSLVPESPWLSIQKPNAPSVSYHDYSSYWSINIEAPKDEDIQWWIVRSKFNDRWEVEYYSVSHPQIDYYGGDGMKRPSELIVSGVNRAGIEGDFSEPINTNIFESTTKDSSKFPENFINREDWSAHEPLGYEANAIKRNLSHGDTLQFRDFSLLVSRMLKSTPYSGDFMRIPSEDEKESTIVDESVIVQFYRNGVSEQHLLKPGEAMNWYGYHIGLIDTNFELGIAQIEVATVTSLPVDRVSALSTGPAEYRLRVPHTINQITVYHSGCAGPLTQEDDPVNVLNNLFEWGAEVRHWWDLPYHYFIDLDGNIYEGRNPEYAGETNTTYDPRGHLLISTMGNYNHKKPTERQLNGISEIMNYAIQTYNLSINDISFQGELDDISCPCGHFHKYNDIETIKKGIEAKLNF